MDPPDNPTLVVDRNQTVRQAGATQGDTAFIAQQRVRAEQSLYFFAKGILGYRFLTDTFHQAVADWVSTVPPARKLLLMPRGHGKTTLVPRAFPLHAWVQPRESNRYFPGEPGVEARILLCGESAERATDNLRVVRTHLEQNDLLRAFWPHVVHARPRRDAKMWNDSALILPRQTEFAEPSLRAIGVGGAITGQHPNVLLKDDITTEAAANSPVVMQTAIDWHQNTRALLSHPATDLEITTATYWHVGDLPHVLEQDPSVETNTQWRKVSDHGVPLWPEKFGLAQIEELMRDFGPRFHLLYMNAVGDAQLVDFPRGELRTCTVVGDHVELPAEDNRDRSLAEDLAKPWQTDAAAQESRLAGRSFTDDDVQQALRKRAYRIRTA